jgi:D-glycero-beta-D-manno-heptose 1-phosphate adenylyltransferase
LGDVLIVAINSDASVRAIKGPARPINKARERALVLASLSSVDYIIVFAERDPRRVLNIIKPDVHVKGGDYTLEQIIEREVVEKHGGSILLIKPKARVSTTNLIRSVLKKYANHQKTLNSPPPSANRQVESER